MKRVLIGAGVVAMVLCVGTVQGAVDVFAEIVAANDTFEAKFAAGDAAGVASLYTDDGQILPPNGEAMSGHEAIAAFWGGAMASGVAGITLTTVEVEQHGDTAIEVGTGEVLDADGNVLDSLNIIVIWKQVDGAWKLHRDIWNSSVAN